MDLPLSLDKKGGGETPILFSLVDPNYCGPQTGSSSGIIILIMEAVSPCEMSVSARLHGGTS